MRVPWNSFEFEKDLSALLGDDVEARRPPQPRKHVSRIKRIKIFDFDNTLFHSPLPNPGLWHRSLIGRLMSPEVGWFHDVRSLSEPFVVEMVMMVLMTLVSVVLNGVQLQEVRDAAAAPDTLAILLTGRLRSVYHARIAELLSEGELQLDLLILREHHDALPSTMMFKQHAIHCLLNLLAHADELTIWEDREHHAVQFERFLASLQAERRLATGAVVRVAPAISYMERRLETRLVQTLIAERNARLPDQQLQLATRIESALLQLNPASLQYLCGYYGVPMDARSSDGDGDGVAIPESKFSDADRRQFGRGGTWKVLLFPVDFRYDGDRITVELMMKQPYLLVKYPLGRQLMPFAAALTLPPPDDFITHGVPYLNGYQFVMEAHADTAAFQRRYKAVFFQLFLVTIILCVFVRNSYLALKVLLKAPRRLASCVFNLFGSEFAPSCLVTAWLVIGSVVLSAVVTNVIIAERAYLAHNRNKWLLAFSVVATAVPAPIFLFVTWLESVAQMSESASCLTVHSPYLPLLRLLLDLPGNVIFSLAFFVVIYRRYRQYKEIGWKELARDGIATLLLVLLSNFVCFLVNVAVTSTDYGDMMYVIDW
ncbi:hypothetical protein SYNPS1DRAFT_21266 [Syncephalis pseudoplumigaleata]|uniref:Swiss Army Knife RNA repair protein HAD domain-containing protein n=1 Tax=Syncephalis pseudoplumigaleata TaxID=1712513 RepID=A0A4P9Z4Y1_9FUNG|nr:hypothetical protein SYNPS1DRAFT_21266 [Syncephalis pseudoplumigaleata]|eukprot:RKP27132.1 hypothetical protein SYNPS1DRAFT_21266 [Syncephalis pseudoplumigaleata]